MSKQQRRERRDRERVARRRARPAGSRRRPRGSSRSGRRAATSAAARSSSRRPRRRATASAASATPKRALRASASGSTRGGCPAPRSSCSARRREQRDHAGVELHRGLRPKCGAISKDEASPRRARSGKRARRMLRVDVVGAVEPDAAAGAVHDTRRSAERRRRAVALELAHHGLEIGPRAARASRTANAMRIASRELVRNDDRARASGSTPWMPRTKRAAAAPLSARSRLGREHDEDQRLVGEAARRRAQHVERRLAVDLEQQRAPRTRVMGRSGIEQPARR